MVEGQTLRGKVYCVDANGVITFVDNQNEGKLFQVQRSLVDHYHNSLARAHDLYWYPGQICALRWDDDSWYRGTVIQTFPEKQMAKVSRESKILFRNDTCS